jgi:histidine phosphotransferase ChpT
MADAACIDMRIVELVCSRLCHELISPIGAINNGVELIEEMAEDGDGSSAAPALGRDALALIAHSARQASVRLGLLRLAYGAAGSEGRLAAATAAAQAYFAAGRVAFAWSADGPYDRPGLVKAILNVVLVAEEALPIGGRLTVQHRAGGAMVTASGSRCALRQECRDALAAGIDGGALSPRTIQAWLTARMVADYNLNMTVESAAERVVFVLG